MKPCALEACVSSDPSTYDAPAVDLSKAKAGDKVKFRCGGEAVIEKLKAPDALGFPEHKVVFADCDDGFSHYHKSGKITHDMLHPFDIIAIEPKPFDWKDVKPGMAFEGPFSGVKFYLGRSIHDPNYIVLQNKDNEATYSSWEQYLTRAPEHDIEVPHA